MIHPFDHEPLKREIVQEWHSLTALRALDLIAHSEAAQL